MSVDDDDADPTNEIQDLYIAGNDSMVNTLHDEIIEYVSLKKYSRDAQHGSTEYTGDSVYITLENSKPAGFSIEDADADTTNEIQNLHEVLTEGNDAGGHRITNLGNPKDPEDMVNKHYVDSIFEQAEIHHMKKYRDYMLWYSKTTGKFHDTVNDELYRFTQIGEQVWMAENLKSTKYRHGEQIPAATLNSGIYKSKDFDNSGDTNDVDSIYYTNNYGIIYDFENIPPSVKDSLCPTGWRLPTENDWLTLDATIGNSDVPGNPDIRGKYLIDFNNTYWAYLSQFDDMEEQYRNMFGFSLRGSGIINNSDELYNYRKSTFFYAIEGGVDKSCNIRISGVNNYTFDITNIKNATGNAYNVIVRCIKE